MPNSTSCALTADQKEIHRLPADRGDGNHHSSSADNTGMQACIDACTHCHRACRQTLAALSRARTSADVAISMQLLLECSDLCALSAQLQLGQSIYSRRLCAICADVCRECERQCAGVAIAVPCATACRLCAQSCEAMAV